MGTKDWTDTALVERLSDNLPLSDEQRAILVTLVVQRAKQDKDADRYRWLRNSSRIPRDADPDGHIVVCSGGGEDVLWGASMDSAIDRDMQDAAAVGAA